MKQNETNKLGYATEVVEVEKPKFEMSNSIMRYMLTELYCVLFTLNEQSVIGTIECTRYKRLKHICDYLDGYLLDYECRAAN